MAKDPAARYASAGDLAVGARAAVEGITAHLQERTVATGEAAPVVGATGETLRLGQHVWEVADMRALLGRRDG